MQYDIKERTSPVLCVITTLCVCPHAECCVRRKTSNDVHRTSAVIVNANVTQTCVGVHSLGTVNPEYFVCMLFSYISYAVASVRKKMHAKSKKQVRESAAPNDCTKISCIRKVGEPRIWKLSAYEIFWIYSTCLMSRWGYHGNFIVNVDMTVVWLTIINTKKLLETEKRDWTWGCLRWKHYLKKTADRQAQISPVSETNVLMIFALQ